jgi:L-ascorbate metabolism protein UlaG (beta-lactamase superfamily)
MPWKNPHYDPTRPHHTPTGFQNLDPTARRFADLRRWQRERRANKLPKAPVQGYDAFRAQWWQQADFSGSGDAAWWLGHACVLLRLGGQTILMDPALSDRVSPVSFAGPRRLLPPGATVATLPRIDVVLISHSHYDHLDKPTIRKLLARFPDATYLVPLNLATWMRARGITKVQELDWWDSTEVGGTTFTFVPAQHWTQRTPWDRNRCLWGGWVVRRDDFRFWFAGDTGYTPRLKEIGDRFGPFDLAAIPIGAYEPRWFMQAQHIDPAQAVQLHRELRSRHSFAIHWGAFELADDALDAPPEVLTESLAEQGVDAASFHVMRTGARLDLPAIGALRRSA